MCPDRGRALLRLWGAVALRLVRRSQLMAAHSLSRGRRVRCARSGRAARLRPLAPWPVAPAARCAGAARSDTPCEDGATGCLRCRLASVERAKRAGLSLSPVTPDGAFPTAQHFARDRSASAARSGSPGALDQGQLGEERSRRAGRAAGPYRRRRARAAALGSCAAPAGSPCVAVAVAADLAPLGACRVAAALCALRDWHFDVLSVEGFRRRGCSADTSAFQRRRGRRGERPHPPRTRCRRSRRPEPHDALALGASGRVPGATASQHECDRLARVGGRGVDCESGADTVARQGSTRRARPCQGCLLCTAAWFMGGS
jgi:hypothetical protein